jgi:hypothetical protein
MTSTIRTEDVKDEELTVMQRLYRQMQAQKPKVKTNPYEGLDASQLRVALKREFEEEQRMLNREEMQGPIILESVGIQFAVFKQPREIVPIYNMEPDITQSDFSFLVDLNRNWISIQFTIEQDYDKYRTFRLESYFSDINECFPIINKKGGRSIIIHLRCPPRILRSKDQNENRYDGYELIQTVDFTDMKRIGECRVFIVHLSHTCEWEIIEDMLMHLEKYHFASPGLKEITINETNGAYPVIKKGVTLKFNVQYMLQCLLSNGVFDKINLDNSFYMYLEKLQADQACRAMEFLARIGKREYDPLTALKNAVNKYGDREDLPVSEFCVTTRRVCITPTRIVYLPPEIDTKHRILRKYPNKLGCFLRVSFTDENLEVLRQNVNAIDDLTTRVKDYLLYGITICERKYDFLAASASQLKEHSCWAFWCDNKGKDALSADLIRAGMGKIKCKSAAKYLARMGQVSTYCIS